MPKKTPRPLLPSSPGSALFKYCKYTRACTKEVLFRTSMYKMYVYKRHIAIKQEVDIHEAGDKAIEKYM